MSDKSKGELNRLMMLLSAEKILETGDPRRIFSIMNRIITENWVEGESAPTYYQAYFERGKVYHHLEEWSRALLDFNTFMTAHADFGPAYYWRGLAHKCLGNFPAAYADFTTALELMDKPMYARFELGLLYLAQGDWENAYTQFNRVLELDPTHRGALLHQAEVWLELGQNPLMTLEFCQEEIQHNDTNPLLYDLLARVYAQMGNPSTAARYGERAMLLKKRHKADVYNERGRIALEQHHYEDAIAHITSALALDATAQYYADRAHAYRELKQFDQAMTDLDRAFSLDPDHPSAYFQRGSVYLELANWEDAIADLQKCKEHPAARYTERENAAFLIAYATTQRDKKG